MKIAVINFSGNVGKSSIANYLLAPRMKCSVLSIESINSMQNQDSRVLRGKEMDELQTELITEENLVVDIGASNVESFVKSIQQYSGGIDEFDMFIVPTVPAKKQQIDTTLTITQLSRLGVNKNSIRVIFNLFDSDNGPIERQYKIVHDYYDEHKNFVMSSKAFIPAHGFFEALISDNEDSEKKRSMTDVLNDEVNYKELISETDDKAAKVDYAKKVGLKRLATGINEELDRLHKVLFDG